MTTENEATFTPNRNERPEQWAAMTDDERDLWMELQEDMRRDTPEWFAAAPTLIQVAEKLTTETKVQHTPGPYKLIKRMQHSSGHGYQWQIIDSEGNEIAASPVGKHAFTSENGILLSAAPTLLEALEACVNQEGDYLGFARHTIALAKGVQDAN